MDKILITSFKSEVANAILNSQEKLNPNKDAYIDESELPAVLDFFGKTDVKELLANPDGQTTSQSVFTESQQNQDDKQKINNDEFINLMDSNNTVLHNEGSAAYELQDNIASDLVMTTASGTPFSAQMNNLYETRKSLIKKHRDTSEIDAKIDALNEAVQEYIKSNKADLTQSLLDSDAVRTFKYGKNDEKTGYFIQTFDFKGGNTSGNDDTSTEATEGTEGADAQDGGNGAGVNVKYGIEVLTDKLHAVANVEAGNDNSDLQGAVVYNNLLKNGGKLSLSGNFRQTIEKNNNRTAFGASLDYNNNKFTTGAYASYQASEVDSEKCTDIDVEAYAKYGSSLRFALGHEYESFGDGGVHYTYVNAKLLGSRELNSSNLSLTGSLEGKYGIATIDGEKLPDYNVLAKGGLTFKSANLKSNVYASVGLDGGKDPLTGSYENVVSGTLVGNISTKKIDVTATLSGTNAPEYSFSDSDSDSSVNNENIDITTSREWNVSSSITVTPKALFGKNSKVVPSITYSVSNGEELKHYVGMNLGVNF